jgi:hypothetical protein
MGGFCPEGCCRFAPDRNWKAAAKREKNEVKRCGGHGLIMGRRTSEE